MYKISDLIVFKKIIMNFEKKKFDDNNESDKTLDAS